MSRIQGHGHFVKMIVLVFVVFLFLESPAIAERKLDLFAESFGREELVKWAGYGEEKLSTVVIEGKLLCRGNGAKGRTSTHPYPVSGGTVAVLCGTTGKTKKSLTKSRTGSYGEFLIDVPSHLHAIPNLEKICHVKVVHLPKSSPCRHEACTGNLKQIELVSIGEGIRTYTTHNIHLIPHEHI